MEEFSVEPPQDDPCTEDESDQMYFMPAGCLDSEDPLRDWHDSLEDVYLSAYDDLSPLYEETIDHHELEEGNIEHGQNEETKKPAENEEMEDRTSDGPRATTTEREEEALCHTQKPFSQPDMVDGSNNSLRDNMNQSSPQSDLSTRATSKVICSREESDFCTEKDQIASVHEDNTGTEATEKPSSRDGTPGDNVDDKNNVEISVPLNLQDGAICRKDSMKELETVLLNLCSPDLPVPEHYDKDISLVDEFNHEDSDSPDHQELDLTNSEVLQRNQPTIMNLNVPEVQNAQYHDKDVPLVQDLTLKDLDSPKHNDKDDILMEENMDSNSKTVQVGLECAEDMKIVQDNMTQKEESQYCPCDNSVHDNPHLTDENAINITGNISLPEILSLLNCLEGAEDKPQETEANPCEEHTSNIGRQLRDTESFQCDLSAPHEMIKSDELSNTVTPQGVTPQDPSAHRNRLSESQVQNSQICSSEEQTLSSFTKSPARSENTGASRINPDGSAAMKLAFTSNKVHQVKSVPLVPPKPQFAKLPPALKSKFHTSSLSTTRDTAKYLKSDQVVGSEPTETGSDCAPKRRLSWRNATSVSFDTAMSLAKERQQSQTPVRRMQTYCIGDSYDVMDCKMEKPSSYSKFTIKPASSRTHRPLSCMSLSSAEAEFRGNNFLREDLTGSSIHGAQSLFQQEAEVYTKELPQRNRLSMPRIGRQSSEDVHIHTGYHQRRSLL